MTEIDPARIVLDEATQTVTADAGVTTRYLLVNIFSYAQGACNT